MTVREYNLRMKGYIVQLIEQEYLCHVTAFAHRAATATDEKGKFIYKSLSDVYDKAKQRQVLLGRKSTPTNRKLVQIAKNLQEFRKERE